MFHVEQNRRETEARLRLRAYGAVQGVGFRWFVRSAARSLHLAGYVLNRRDGSVELEAAGPETALAELRRTVEHGPPHAHVERVDTIEPGTGALPSPFEIRREGS